MKPIIKYRGGKSKEIPYILKQIPDYSGRYVEPFFGGGALFFHLEPEKAIINDINKKLIDFYIGIRDDFETVSDDLKFLEAVYIENRTLFDIEKEKCPNERVDDLNEEWYYRLRDMFNGKQKYRYHPSAVYYYINKTAYSGMIRYNSKGEYNVPFGRYKNFNTDLLKKEHSLLLNKAEIYNKDYKEIFDMTGPDDFMFLDPPYDCIFSDYGNEQYKTGFGEDEHRRLAEDFKNLSCKAMMVIGGTELIRDLYRGFIKDEYDKSYSVNIRNRFKSETKHLIITNF